MCMDKTLNAQGMDANAGIFQMRHVFESTPGLRRRKVPVLCIDRISFGCSCEFVCLKNCLKKKMRRKNLGSIPRVSKMRSVLSRHASLSRTLLDL